jgi:hypothetical protein
LLDTSQGTNFQFTWSRCRGLTSFPLLDTSRGATFSHTWSECSSLVSFPSLNLSSSLTFEYTWELCTNLAEFPPNMFDSSLTGNFAGAWQFCALTPQSIENILVSLDTSGVTGGILGINGGTNAGFVDWTSPAHAAYNNLISKSWTIFHR